eukprot:TRINITY_DN5791_c0_g1_i24.p1 TRINITY_DN5791_c0_g1~~TRINITY_DN5791_c0_g1_i24.p1  ORF type:complete len:398 (-),score=77.27 TRINITY_DN5791_c0_g1_i24:13-1206(-)
MYETRRLFRIPDSQINLKAYDFSKATFPEMTYLEIGTAEYLGDFRPLFTLNETFPCFFENSPPPEDPADLLLCTSSSNTTLEPPVSASKLGRLRKITKWNKRLLRKIDSILELLGSVGVHALQAPNTENLKLSFNRSLLIGNLPGAKRMSDEELRKKIEKQEEVVLEQVKNWPASSGMYRNVVDALEKYKRLAVKYVRRYYRKENPLEQLRNLLLKVRNTHITEANSLNANDNPVEAQEKHNQRRKYIRTRYKHLWTQLNLYFLQPNQETKSSLLHFQSVQYHNNLPIQFLNMFAVNRLSAIAKMLQYCADNGTTVAEFMDDRTYQKVKARLKRAEEAVLMGDAKEVVCPSLEEVDFLLSLGKENVADAIGVLKLSLIHICRCRRYAVCRSRWSPYH